MSSLFTRGSEGSEKVGQGAQTFEKKAKAKLASADGEAEGVSILEDAIRKSSFLLSKLRRSGAKLDRLPLWLGVRRKTKKNIAKCYDLPEITDEVTEKVFEVAQEDPFYKRLFG